MTDTLTKIDSFRGQWGALSNYDWTFPIEVLCVVCSQEARNPLAHEVTTEHAFHAAKTNDVTIKHQILTATSPGNAKKLGRTLQLRADWENVKYNIMRSLLLRKFSNTPEATAFLLSTGSAELIEGNNWHDTYWGRCTGCRQGCVDNGWNRLGKLLEEVRRELR